jgi:type II secretory pathway predicted ATPase ExeA/cell division septation protein DedD
VVPHPASDRANGYEPFFGFHQAPFSLAPDTRFRFQSASHAAALAQVTYALERREPVIVVTGEIGTGKTLLCRTVVERLERQTFLSVISDPLLGPDDLLKQMLQDFGVVSRDRTKLTPTSRHDLVHALQEFLLSLAPLQAHAVVIIDEAQHAQPDLLEQIRLVSNIQDERGTMLQIILVGQTDLERLLSRPELHQVKQRVSRFARLDALSAAEVAQYIGHRLTVAQERRTESNIPGAKELQHELAEWDRPDSNPTFTPEAVHAVAELSGGIPRVVNLLCDRALEAAYARELRIVDASLIGTAAHALALSAPEAAASLSVEGPQPLTRPQLVPTSVSIFDTPLPARVGGLARRYILIVASLVLVAAAIWFARRATPIATSRPASAPAATIQTTATPQAEPVVVAPPREIAVEPSPAVATSTVLPVPEATGTAARSAESTGDVFEIVVASFRTAARATDVAANVAALGQPVRQRTTGGWQQVLAGPYASSAQAREAQQRLERAGFIGTRIVTAAR